METKDSFSLRIRLGPIYNKRQRQRCDDACDSVLIKNNRVTPEWVCNPFSSDSTGFNENRITSVTAALTLTLGVNGPLYWHEIESDITSRWVDRESNLMSTLISDKDQRKNRLRDRLV